MSVIEEAIYTRLSSYAGMAALVSVRIYPVGEVPQNVSKPYVTYQRITTVRESAMGSDLGVAHPRFQFNGWGETYTSAKSVAVQLRGALQRWRGTVSTVVVQDTYLTDERDLYDPETQLRGVSIDAIIWHRE